MDVSVVAWVGSWKRERRLAGNLRRCQRSVRSLASAAASSGLPGAQTESGAGGVHAREAWRGARAVPALVWLLLFCKCTIIPKLNLCSKKKKKPDKCTLHVWGICAQLRPGRRPVSTPCAGPGWPRRRLCSREGGYRGVRMPAPAQATARPSWSAFSGAAGVLPRGLLLAQPYSPWEPRRRALQEGEGGSRGGGTDGSPSCRMRRRKTGVCEDRGREHRSQQT